MTTMTIGDFFTSGAAEKGSRSPARGILITIFWEGLSLTASLILVDNVLNKLILANIPVAALSFALLGGFNISDLRKEAVYVSIVVGFFGVFLLICIGEKQGTIPPGGLSS